MISFMVSFGLGFECCHFLHNSGCVQPGASRKIATRSVICSATVVTQRLDHVVDNFPTWSRPLHGPLPPKETAHAFRMFTPDACGLP
jgi:hypothetical protein